jgi:hypothetical protein
MRKTMRRINALAIALIATGCTGLVDGSGPGSGEEGSGSGSGSDVIPENELEGAGGRDLTEYWPNISVPFGENTKMLIFEQIRTEVMRATGRSWLVSGVDQWEANRGVLGGADYVRSFMDDRTPSQQKLVTIRKMAFTVCGDVVTAEAGQATRTVFAAVDPAVTIDTNSAIVTTQVQALWKRFFLATPSAADVTESLSALGSLQTMSNSREAWRGLCAGYLSSLRFLTY